MSLSAQRTRLVAALLAAFVLHAAFGSAMEIRGARPNLTLCTLLIECLFVGANTGAALGFLAGLLEGSFVAVYLGSYLVTRTLAGFAVGAQEERLFRNSPFVAVTTVLVVTALTEGCFFLFAPQPHALRWLIRTGAEALYNALLALPLYLLLRRLVRPRETV